MPRKTVTIFTCSACQKDQEPDAVMHQMKLSANGDGTLHYDICDECKGSNKAVISFLGMGERRRAGGGVVPAPRAKKAPAKPARKRTAVAVTSPVVVKDGMVKCPSCDYKHKLSRVVANHRSREHGYVSPRKK